MLFISPSEIPDDFQLKTKVMHAVDGPLEDVSVKSICKNCGISRSRFYSLFKSKYDIGHWYLTFVYDVSLGKIGIDLSWEQGVELCLDLMDEERTYFALTAVTPVTIPSLYWAIRGEREGRIKAVLRERGVKLTKKLETEVVFYAQAIDVLLVEWVSSEHPLSRDEYVQIWLECVPRTLFDSLAL